MWPNSSLCDHYHRHWSFGKLQDRFNRGSVPDEMNPPIVLHYNVRLQGDKVTEDPVIVQNTWTAPHEWNAEERCPSAIAGNNKKVDDLKQCSEKVGKIDNRRPYLPFKLGYLSVMTLRVGEEGFHMTVESLTESI
ncbi:hypothetical protein HRI_004083200 [Hibiscus trionum]|uniref:Galectin n=1 Tax=Hibiscus trionum TaxID=183268 RepID=A0A9W7IY97_HIBTR|nr:hypothetical protein HRI_004083200 [Hibiscus trionum]